MSHTHNYYILSRSTAIHISNPKSEYKGENQVQAPKPSKLELYLEILRSVEGKKPNKIEAIKRRTNLDDSFVSHAINFLEKQNLVEKRTNKDQATYKSTNRGERLSRYFIELAHGDLYFIYPNDMACKERYPE